MAVKWTITSGGQTRELHEWGVADVVKTTVSQDRDTVSFRTPGVPYDGTPIFTYGADLTVERDGVPWFAGTVVQTPRAATDRTEEIGFLVENAWGQMSRIVFEVETDFWDTTTEGVVPVYSGIIALNMGSAGETVSLQAQLTAALNYAIAQGADFQVGQILPGTAIYTAPHEVSNLMVSQVVDDQLQLVPDAVAWFDYTTTPPTFHIVRRADLTAKTLDLAAANVGNRSITARPDLQVPSVAIKYMIATEEDDEIYRSIEQDLYPPTATGREIGALIATIDTRGPKSINLEATAVFQAFKPNERAWWETKHGWMKDNRFELTSFGAAFSYDPLDSHVLVSEENEAWELIQGSIPSWAQTAYNLTVKERVFSRNISYRMWDRDIVSAPPPAALMLETVTDRRFSTRVKPVRLPSHWTAAQHLAFFDEILDDELPVVGRKTFRISQTVEDGDVIPAGLAQVMYEALGRLQHEGTVELREEEASGAVALGMRLSLAGGATSWATMDMPVQGVTERIDDGHTLISFGPPNQLSPQQLIEWMRALRPRRRYSSTADLHDAAQSTGDRIEIPRHVANLDTTAGQPVRPYLGVTSPETHPLTAQPGPIRTVGMNANNLGNYSHAYVESVTFNPASPAQPTAWAKLHADHLRIGDLTLPGSVYAAIPTYGFFASAAQVQVKYSVDLTSAQAGLAAGSASASFECVKAGAGVRISTADCGGKLLTVREVSVCESVGGVDTTRKMLVLASATY